MRNDMRPELSQKNPYWIGKHRYYELKHFCLQYPIWKKARLALDGLSRRPADLQVFVSCGQVKGDPTERCAQSRIFFGERMEMVEQAAIEAEPDLYPYLLRGVTEELSYDALKMKYDIPCCRDVYYAAYRRFFWLLSKRRDGGCGLWTWLSGNATGSTARTAGAGWRPTAAIWWTSAERQAGSGARSAGRSGMFHGVP